MKFTFSFMLYILKKHATENNLSILEVHEIIFPFKLGAFITQT